jgi:hypothetical protein
MSSKVNRRKVKIVLMQGFFNELFFLKFLVDNAQPLRLTTVTGKYIRMFVNFSLPEVCKTKVF